ncbi:MAG: type II toxin-antitoxin system RelB/DinJ family antitoxin [Synergistaceae bacterium]|nr:type II toxin-antitoxin system RelB/DinJ family antitoxin [Synergistaceae bacterium]
MPTSTITASIDETDSRDFSAFCDSVGLNVSTAVNLFVKAVLREKRIPFPIEQTPDPFYSPENQAYVLKSVKELREGKGHIHDLIEGNDD